MSDLWERHPLIAVYANPRAKNALVLVHVSPVEVFINGRKLDKLWGFETLSQWRHLGFLLVVEGRHW